MKRKIYFVVGGQDGTIEYTRYRILKKFKELMPRYKYRTSFAFKMSVVSMYEMGKMMRQARKYYQK